MSNNNTPLQQLDKFVGQWNTTGEILATSTTPEIKISGRDTYEWLPGEHFLLHKADVMIGDDHNQTFEIIGFDAVKKIYTMQHYNNKGHTGFMSATVINNRWVFQGDTLRFKGGFTNNDKIFSGIWE